MYSEKSLDLSEIIKLLGDIAKYKIVDQGGFPEESMRATGTVGAKGSCVVPKSLSDNVAWLHEFLFNDTSYTPSSAVQQYSDKIVSDTSGYPVINIIKKKKDHAAWSFF